MESFWDQSLFFARSIARHMVVMMYWVWIPGLFISAVVALRYREAAAEQVRRSEGGSVRSIFFGALLGVTLTTGRKRSLQASLGLLREGLHPSTTLAVYLSSRNLVLYFLAIWMLLLGLEFAVGQVIGTLAMIALAATGLRYLVPAEELKRVKNLLQSHEQAPSTTFEEPAETSWRGLLLSPRGWWNILRYIGREMSRFVLPLVAGVLVGGVILSAGLRPWWVDLDSVGGGGLLTDVLNALIAPALSLVSAIGPVGSLPVASNLFKASGLAYPGLLAFVLAGALKPQDLAALCRALGRRVAFRVATLLYFSAAVAGLIVTGVFALFGFRPGHVPLFRELVDQIIIWFMPGMGGM